MRIMFSYISSAEVGGEDLSESLKCPASLMISHTSSVAGGFEALREHLTCPASLMFSYISSVEVGLRGPGASEFIHCQRRGWIGGWVLLFCCGGLWCVVFP